MAPPEGRSGWPGAAPHVHPNCRASWPGPDLDLVADLMHDPKPAAATGRIRGGPEPARQRIGDLALILHLADDLITGDPQRQGPWPAGVSQRVSGQFGNRDHQIVDPIRREPSPARPRSGEVPDTGQASPVPEHFGPIGGRAQRLTGPGPRRP